MSPIELSWTAKKAVNTLILYHYQVKRVKGSIGDGDSIHGDNVRVVDVDRLVLTVLGLLYWRLNGLWLWNQVPR